MKKDELLEKFSEDFDKQRGALTEIVSHNRKISNTLLEDMEGHNFKSLEEFVELNKLILDGVKALTSLYSEVPKILKSTQDLNEEGKKSSINLNELMKD